MLRRIHREPHLTLDELERRYRGAQELYTQRELGLRC